MSRSALIVWAGLLAVGAVLVVRDPGKRDGGRPIRVHAERTAESRAEAGTELVAAESSEPMRVAADAARVPPAASLEPPNQLIPPDGGITVSGWVRDENGEPVERARVDVRVVGGSRLRSIVRYMEGSDGLTGASGAFQLVGLPRQDLVLSADGPFSAAQQVHVTGAAGDAHGIVLTVVRGGCIAGRVTWADGRPAQRFEVTASGRDGSSRTMHASDGDFYLCALGPGEYVVEVLAHEAGVSGRARAEGVFVRGPQLELVLAQSTDLRGIVRDLEGAPVRGFSVRWTSAADGRSGSSSFGTAVFVLDGLSPGEVALAVVADGFLTAERRVVVGAADAPPLVIELARAGRVRGRVVDAVGRSVRGARVSVVGGPRASSGPDGSFELHPPGPDPCLQAEAEGHAPSEELALALMPGAMLEGVVLGLREPCRIEGRVWSADRQGVAGAFVRGLRAGCPERQAETDSEGRFVLTDLPPGPLALEALGGFEHGRATLAVTLAHSVTEVELRFDTPDPVLLRGRVTRSGHPFVGAVLLRSASFFARAETDSDGRFGVTLPRHGAWHGALDPWPSRTRPELRAFELVVPDETTHEVELEFDALVVIGSLEDVFGR